MDFYRLLYGRALQLDSDANAFAQGQANVFLDPVPFVRHHQDVLPRHQVQQEQHRAARQVVLQLQVSQRSHEISLKNDNWRPFRLYQCLVVNLKSANKAIS